MLYDTDAIPDETMETGLHTVKFMPTSAGRVMWVCVWGLLEADCTKLG
jgi:hypothetical protein